MVLISEKTLGEIAAEHPAAVRVLEKYGIDYCCGGDRSVEQACREKGIQAEQLLAEVAGATPGVEDTDWSAAPLAALADHIVNRHHGYLRSELPALALMIDKVIVAHGQNHSDSLLPLRETFAGLREELTSHMMKEEVILFPLIKRMEAAEKAGSGLPRAHCGSVNNPIRVMEYEHDNAAKALRDMRRITSDYALPRYACSTYRALFHRLTELEQDLHVHIHLENNILFPRASEVERRILTQEGGHMADQQLVESLKDQPFVRDLPDRFLEKLPGLTEVVRFREDDIIFRSGEESSYLYLLVSGSVCIELRTPVYAICIQALAPGDPFGWSSLLGHHTTFFQVRAREPVAALRLDAGRLATVCRENPEFGFELYRRLSEVLAARVRATESRLAEFCGVTRPAKLRANCKPSWPQ